MKRGHYKDPAKGVKRISISLPPEIFAGLDQLVDDGKFSNRSQAISEMIHRSLNDYYQEYDEQVMAGTITLFFDESKPGLLQLLSKIQRDHIDEVVGSQSILLEDDLTMQVILCQGAASSLKAILDQLIACKGVRSGKLEMSSAILPQIIGRQLDESSDPDHMDSAA